MLFNVCITQYVTELSCDWSVEEIAWYMVHVVLTAGRKYNIAFITPLIKKPSHIQLAFFLIGLFGETREGVNWDAVE